MQRVAYGRLCVSLLIESEPFVRHFPPARVWPPTEEPIKRARTLFASDFGVQFPPKEEQAKLLDLFFAHVNPSLPLFSKESFMKAWRAGES